MGWSKEGYIIGSKSWNFYKFSQDHLDFHKTMDRYLNAKLLLFKEIRNQSSVITDKEIIHLQIKKYQEEKILK